MSLLSVYIFTYHLCVYHHNSFTHHHHNNLLHLRDAISSSTQIPCYQELVEVSRTEESRVSSVQWKSDRHFTLSIELF